MEQLVVYYKTKILNIDFDYVNKYAGCSEYNLRGKNGFFIFLNNMNKWEHVYGDLVDGLREAIIDALILRFTKPTKMFYFKGKRMVIDIGWTNGGGSWHIYANRFFIGTIAYPRTGTDFRFLIHNEAEWLTDEMKEEFISMLKRKEIKWPDDDLPNIPLS